MFAGSRCTLLVSCVWYGVITVHACVSVSVCVNDCLTMCWWSCMVDALVYGGRSHQMVPAVKCIRLCFAVLVNDFSTPASCTSVNACSCSAAVQYWSVSSTGRTEMASIFRLKLFLELMCVKNAWHQKAATTELACHFVFCPWQKSSAAL